MHVLIFYIKTGGNITQCLIRLRVPVIGRNFCQRDGYKGPFQHFRIARIGVGARVVGTTTDHSILDKDAPPGAIYRVTAVCR